MRFSTAAALALALGLNGIGLCLCARQPVKPDEVHACCPGPASHDDRGASATPAVLEPSLRCHGALVVPALARIADRDGLRYPLTAVAATYASADASIATPTIDASTHLFHGISGLRPTVLRI